MKSHHLNLWSCLDTLCLFLFLDPQDEGFGKCSGQLRPGQTATKNMVGISEGRVCSLQFYMRQKHSPLVSQSPLNSSVTSKFQVWSHSLQVLGVSQWP